MVLPGVDLALMSTVNLGINRKNGVLGNPQQDKNLNEQKHIVRKDTIVKQQVDLAPG